MTTTILEREIKLRFASADEARDAVLATGATPLFGRRLQEDALLDTEDEDLRRKRCVLRVRMENGKSRLTYKGPVQQSFMTEREELETVVGVFVEIEGSEQGIADTTAALGRTPADYIVDSYRALFLQHREELGLNGPDMVFDTSA
jgi:hypothetical protein